MADATARGLVASVFKRSRLKPEIYKTIDGKIIVEDEFLNFLAVKIKTLSQDEIVLLAANTFESDWIETSKKVLFELCPTTQRNVSHRGAQKDINNVKSCLKVLNECGENTPRFVSHYLDELPPVSFNNIDVSSLIGKLEQLSAELCSVKSAMHLQANVCGDLRAITTDINRRTCALERSTVLSVTESLEVSAVNVGATSVNGAAAAALVAASLEESSSATTGETAAAECSTSCVQRVERSAFADGAGGLTSTVESPKRSCETVMKMVFIKEETEDARNEDAFSVKYKDTGQQTEMAFIKEESGDLRIEETFEVKHEDTEEQTDLIPLKEQSQQLNEENYKNYHYLTAEDFFNCSQTKKTCPQKRTKNTGVGSNFTCQQCGKSSSTKGNLDIHMRVHTGEKPYTCQQCGKSFTAKGNLDAHMRTHTGEKPFTCQQCGKSFTTKGNLDVHTRVHTGEKPFTCLQCGKSFTKKGNLEAHMRIHTGEKPYACKLCGKSFAKKGNLDHHMRTHTREKH